MLVSKKIFSINILGVRQENSALRVEVETMRNQMTDINTAQLNRDGDMTKLRVERDRISAEKSGLELVLKQKDDELSGITKEYEILTQKCKELTRDRNRLKIQTDEFEVNKQSEEFSVKRLRSDLERHQTELDQLNEVINKKDNEIKGKCYIVNNLH